MKIYCAAIYRYEEVFAQQIPSTIRGAQHLLLGVNDAAQQHLVQEIMRSII